MMVKLTDGSVEAHQASHLSSISTVWCSTRDALQWSVQSGTWTKIGTVVDAVSTSQRQLFNGEEYDYVFDVDVHEGQPPLKLPYNATRKPNYLT